MKTFFQILGYFVIFLILYGVLSFVTLPNVQQLKGCFTTSMNKVYLCPRSANYVKISEISPNIKNAIIISEDASFYSHHGFDFDEMQNSFKNDLAHGVFARGGSTITQQLAKNLFLSKEKSIVRKLKEAILTKRIEEHFSKNVILEKYLNVIELGENIYGVKAGCEYYFKKSPAQVTPLEAAFLALLLPNPEKYSVSFKKKELTPFARRRAKDILYKMSFYKKISSEEYELAKEQLESLFKPIPQMVDEPTSQEMDAQEKEEATYDMSQMHEIQEKQKESIDELKDPEPIPEDAP